MNLKISTYIILLCLGSNIYSQNLIRNGSFDEVRSYSHRDNHSQTRAHFTDNARFWNTPNGGTPDIIKEEYRSDIKYDRSLGPSTPRSGDSMLGIRVYGCYKNSISHCREFIQTKTKSTLLKGRCYEYEFYVQPNSRYTKINGIGIGFTQYEIDDMSKTSIIDVEQRIISEEILYEGDGKWIKVSGTFSPQNDYNHISIGNFLNDSENTIKKEENKSKFGYYYIDDVAIYELYCESGFRKNVTINFTLENINFNINSYQLNDQLSKKIESIYTQIKDMSFKKIIVNGHTDDTGSQSYNIELSQKRADAVLEKLVSLGIPRSKISALSHGSSKPVDLNKKSANRRVEISVQ